MGDASGRGVGLRRPRFSAADVVREAISGRKIDAREVAFRWLLLLTLLVSLGVLIALIANVASTGWHVFADRGASFLSSGNSALASRAGIRQALVGSGMLMLFVVVLAFPIGVGAAVYLEEYARDTSLTRFLSANIRNLAGVPSIVYGLLGLAIFVEAMRGFTGGLTVISGGLTVAVLVLPLVIITSAEAIRAVPDAIREAGYGVGATKWQVIRSHVLPAAAPGIFTGTILSIARAFGETAPILLVGAQLGFFSSGAGGLADKLHGPYTSLPTIIFTWSSQPEADFKQLAAAAILVLLGVLLIVNSAAIILRNRYERAR
jgi:phosphate transport system permease protein